MTQVLAIGIGGAIGSLLRFWMSTWVHSFAGRGFPYGTLTVNVLGCLVMGVLFVLFTERLSDNAVLRAGMLIGVLGGFTTFSSFSIETFNLIEQGAHLKALANMGAEPGPVRRRHLGGRDSRETTMKHSDVTMVRIYLTEAEKLTKMLLARLHDEEQVRGVTVFRGVSGFGRSGKMHSSGLLDLSLDLPVVIEFFDEPAKVKRILRISRICCRRDTWFPGRRRSTRLTC